MNRKGILFRLAVSRRRVWLVAGSIGLSLLLGVPGSLRAAPQGQTPGPFIVLLGAPAAGKTLHGTSLGQKYNIPVVHATEILEREIRRASASVRNPSAKGIATRRAQRARSALVRLRNGGLADDEIMNGFIASRLSQDDCRNGFIIDGFPNSAEQADFLDSFLQSRNISDLAVIYLDIPDEVSLARMQQRGRVDDTRGFGEERLRQFRSSISALLEFYDDAELLTVSTLQDALQVHNEIVEFLETR